MTVKLAGRIEGRFIDLARTTTPTQDITALGLTDTHLTTIAQWLAPVAARAARPQTGTQPKLTGPQIETLIADATGLYDFLDNRTKQPRYVEARALAYHLARVDGWSILATARWTQYAWRTINYALNETRHHQQLAAEATTIYEGIRP